ncbi:ribonuclease YeeF family protein [Sporosarcina sp. HYO08]|uniref:ribonuclease YeeF family protein n=1 Tax=Sporosarcina sp. HYO08 TaxID=1759557 RepID=UPI000799B232|nr:T7SS effector LXG polymorphic toxin [Sporosarcina sp. HYO08]KXH78558.1 hypothetical protein AU377_12830 [Sporosarcina sp. HYO08]
MKVLDVDLLQEGIQRNVAMLSRQRQEIEAISSTINAFVALEEELKGQGGDAIRAFYEECHLPFLQFLMTFQGSFTQVLKSMEAALRGFEPDAVGFIRESFLERETEQGLQQIAQLTESLTDEANSIMDQVSDIVALPHLDDSEVQEGVRHAKIKRDDTNTGLYEFDASQTYALTTIEQDLATMEMWLSELQGLFKEGLTGVNFSADRWAMLSATNTLWTDLIHRTMPLGSLQLMQGIDGSPGFPYVPATGGLLGVSASSQGEAVEGNVGADVAKGIGAGLLDAGKDFVSGIWDFVTNPKESIEGVVHAVTHPVETYTYLKNAIVESYERDVINGDAYSRSRWFSYAIGTTVGSVVGTKGAGALTKTTVAAAKPVLKTGVATAQNSIQSSMAQLLPYGPRMQVAMPGDVPFNVMNGPVIKEQLISKAKVIEAKGTGKVENFGKYSTKIDDKVKVIEKVDLPNWISESFTDGNYRTVMTKENVTLYRTYGGGAKIDGSFVSTSPAGNRINAKISTALVPDWKNSRQFEAVIEVPEGQILNIGRVEKQFTKTGALLEGNGDQILLPQGWPSEWIKEIREVPSR